jgi:hypothetical protein
MEPGNTPRTNTNQTMHHDAGFPTDKLSSSALETMACAREEGILFSSFRELATTGYT